MEPRRRNRTRCCQGKLDANGPLAVPQMPCQQKEPQVYEPPKALIRGTLYPCLDLPFMGMVNKLQKQDSPKTRLQILAFAIQELALYLDTHPEDEKALALYRQYQQLYGQQRREYGVLNHMDMGKGDYNWLCDPWPWEYCANKEG